MSQEQLFLMVFGVAVFGVGMLNVIDSIFWRRKREAKRELRKIGLEIDEDERAWQRVRERR